MSSAIVPGISPEFELSDLVSAYKVANKQMKQVQILYQCLFIF